MYVILTLQQGWHQKPQLQKPKHDKPHLSGVFPFFAIFHCKSPCWLPKFDLEYFNALLKYESCVKNLFLSLFILIKQREEKIRNKKSPKESHKNPKKKKKKPPKKTITPPKNRCVGFFQPCTVVQIALLYNVHCTVNNQLF